ncbi:MAG: leucine-rich repeat domain-containing protein, partial [Actinobacteria bacterium]|nr:leucine-rich repeat domain-containing protein [Actinomycetota bacterium]
GYQSETATGFGDLGDLWNGITVVRIGGEYACTTDGLAEGSGTFTVAQFTVTANTGCTGRVEIPQAVTSIAVNALQSSGITSLVIPTSLKSVGDQALNGVSSLISVTFHDGSNLQTIGINAFRQTGITSITLPASLESIGDYAFWADTALTSVTFADNSKLNSIGGWAFESSGLTAITIPASVESIGALAFYNSQSLASVKFAAGSVLEHIGESAFRSIIISEITIPASVETIDNYAFYTSSQLARVTFLGDAPDTMGVEVFNGTATGSAAHVSDTALGFGESGATWNGLNIVLVGGSYDCVSDGLHTGTFTVTNLTVVSNESCEGFAEIPHGVQSIDDDAFENSGLDSVSIASTVVSIGQDSFSGSSVLEKIQFFGDAPSTVGVDAFDDVETGADAYVSNTATGFGDEGS